MYHPGERPEGENARPGPAVRSGEAGRERYPPPSGEAEGLPADELAAGWDRWRAMQAGLPPCPTLRGVPPIVPERFTWKAIEPGSGGRIACKDIRNVINAEILYGGRWFEDSVGIDNAHAANEMWPLVDPTVGTVDRPTGTSLRAHLLAVPPIPPEVEGDDREALFERLRGITVDDFDSSWQARVDTGAVAFVIPDGMYLDLLERLFATEQDFRIAYAAATSGKGKGPERVSTAFASLESTDPGDPRIYLDARGRRLPQELLRASAPLDLYIGLEVRSMAVEPWGRPAVVYGYVANVGSETGRPGEIALPDPVYASLRSQRLGVSGAALSRRGDKGEPVLVTVKRFPLAAHFVLSPVTADADEYLRLPGTLQALQKLMDSLRVIVEGQTLLLPVRWITEIDVGGARGYGAIPSGVNLGGVLPLRVKEVYAHIPGETGALSRIKRALVATVAGGYDPELNAFTFEISPPSGGTRFDTWRDYFASAGPYRDSEDAIVWPEAWTDESAARAKEVSLSGGTLREASRPRKEGEPPREPDIRVPVAFELAPYEIANLARSRVGDEELRHWKSVLGRYAAEFEDTTAHATATATATAASSELYPQRRLVQGLHVTTVRDDATGAGKPAEEQKVELVMRYLPEQGLWYNVTPARAGWSQGPLTDVALVRLINGSWHPSDYRGDTSGSFFAVVNSPGGGLRTEVVPLALRVQFEGTNVRPIEAVGGV